jgi:quercetin dioxygenase-like cupin family protein
MVTAGELTFIQAGKEMVYRPGDYFYESGNVVHTAENRTKAPVRVTFFEILPVDWSGPTVILPKAY